MATVYFYFFSIANVWLSNLCICLSSSADLSITLRNKGKDSYKPEVYGNAIIVDLKITREGLRTYKLKTKKGKSLTLTDACQ